MTDRDPPKVRLVPSALYAAKRANLAGEQLDQVEQTEQGIEDDPDHYDDRWDSDDGGRIDYSPWLSGSMIKYRRDDRPGHEGEVELVDLRDFDIGPQRRWPEEHQD